MRKNNGKQQKRRLLFSKQPPRGSFDQPIRLELNFGSQNNGGTAVAVVVSSSIGVAVKVRPFVGGNKRSFNKGAQTRGNDVGRTDAVNIQLVVFVAVTLVFSKQSIGTHDEWTGFVLQTKVVTG